VPAQIKGPNQYLTLRSVTQGGDAATSTRADGDQKTWRRLLWSGEDGMASSMSADRETAWEHRLHWEEVEEVADRLRPLEHAGNCQSRDLDGGLRRRRGLKMNSPFPTAWNK
jgi:hypothetical protein